MSQLESMDPQERKESLGELSGTSKEEWEAALAELKEAEVSMAEQRASVQLTHYTFRSKPLGISLTESDSKTAKVQVSTVENTAISGILPNDLVMALNDEDVSKLRIGDLFSKITKLAFPLKISFTSGEILCQ
jgi:hypothetical protein